jgi:predicted phage terminase large subunit-like protein
MKQPNHHTAGGAVAQIGRDVLSVLSPDDEEERKLKDAERCENSLHEFIVRAWPVLEPETVFKDNWHIGYICEYLEAVTAGEIKRLLVNEPPRHSKSHCAAIHWPVWSWIRQPALRYMYLSYDAMLATEHSLKRRDLIQSRWFQERWGRKFRLRGDANLKTQFENDRTGVMYSASLTGSVTGHSGEIIVIDDPHSRDDMDNDAAIEANVRAYRANVPQCITDPERAAIVVICQQVNEKDLSNWLLKTEPGRWTHVLLEAEATEKRTYIFPRSGKTYVREQGEALHQTYWALDRLHAQIPVLGRRGYDSQYQQSPSPVGGGIVKRAWFRFYRLDWCPDPKGIMPVLPNQTEADEDVQSWDMSFKAHTDSSYVAGQRWRRKGANKYLLEEIHEHLDFPNTCRKLQLWDKQYPRDGARWVEDAANGPAVIAQLHGVVPRLIAVRAEGSKPARLSAASRDIEAGNVYLPDPEMPGYGWVNDFIDEVCKCYSEKSGLWDRADAMSQALNKLGRMTATMPASEVVVGQARPEERRLEHGSFRKMNF